MTTFPQLLPVSAEFLALCQQQLQLLAQGVGSDWSILYLAQPDCENQEMGLTAITAYPARFLKGSSAVATGKDEVVVELEDWPIASASEPSDRSTQGKGKTGKVAQTSTAFPLFHEDLILGILTTGRQDRPWRSPEISQINLVAQSIVFACVLDQQKSWATQQLSQQQQLQELEQEHFHDLLHQLRNPTMAIGTFGKLLLKRLAVDDRNQTVVEGVVRESDRLKSLLSEFSKEVDYLDAEIQTLSAGSMLALPPEKAPVNPAETKSALPLKRLDIVAVIKPIVASMAAIAEEKDQCLRCELPVEPMWVLGNENALTEVITNLLENAIKYTPLAGQIFLEIQTTALGVGVAVHDMGYGIPAADLPHVFERHYRGIQAQGEIHGTGLGLAIAHDLVEKMGGDLEVDSPTLGLPHTEIYPGSTFTLWLKAAPAGDLN